ncbi:MAG: ribonuclease III [Oscillospiraceae bacterium]|nr:ribonuclease III [Oscillospiraceae bacterium]
MREKMSEAETNRLGVLALAHVGDAVYELLIRSRLAAEGPSDVERLHRQTVGYVRAEAQSAAVERLLPVLSEAEAAVYRRGRNSRSHAAPRHAGAAEYHRATGLEALFGWLYLQGKTERIRELFDRIMEDSDHGA